MSDTVFSYGVNEPTGEISEEEHDELMTRHVETLREVVGPDVPIVVRKFRPEDLPRG
jgi:hypothetical protein